MNKNVTQADTVLFQIGKRLSTYLKSKHIGINELGKLTHTSGAQVSNIIKGKNYGITKLIAILEACPELNPLWLLQGRGEMMGNAEKEMPGVATSKTSDHKGQVKEITEANELLQKEIDKLKLKNSSLEGAVNYQNLTIEAYKSSLEIVSATNKDLK
jgi:transcriptional regulator with XRE-family HTH domain